MARPPRLLFLVNEALFFTTHRMPVALAARDRGFEVHVAAPYDETFVAVIRANGFPYHDIPLKRGTRGIVGELRLIAALYRLLRGLEPDLVHHVAMKPVIWGGIISRLCRVPAAVFAITGLGYLFTGRGPRFRLQQAALKLLYRFALGHRRSKAIFQNPDDLALFRASRLVREDQVVMIRGCGVDLRHFAAQPEPGGTPIAMFPARILGDKGAREFVAAAEILKAQGSTARFVMVGRTDLDNPTAITEAEIATWTEAGLVEWWGYATDMPKILAQALVICMPSYREGLPRGLIEAAAVGRAIVTADVPGCREVVRHEENGLLVPARDGEATAQAIARLLEDAPLRRRLAAQGRAIAEAEFSVEAFIADTLAVYRALCPGALCSGAFRPEETAS